MAIVINGSGTVTGLAVGGLPDGTVDAGTLATNSVDSAELVDGAVDDSHIAALAASKLTGALPAISGAALTGITTGKVLQLQHNQLSSLSGVDTTSTSLVDTGLSISITPTSSSNKMVIVNLGGLAYRGSSYPNGKVTIHSSLTNGTLVEVARYHLGENDTVTGFYGAGVSTSVEESLSSWSSGAITYKVQIASGTGANYAYSSWGKASLYVMEIAG